MREPGDWGYGTVTSLVSRRDDITPITILVRELSAQVQVSANWLPRAPPSPSLSASASGSRVPPPPPQSSLGPPSADADAIARVSVSVPGVRQLDRQGGAAAQGEDHLDHLPPPWHPMLLLLSPKLLVLDRPHERGRPEESPERDPPQPPGRHPPQKPRASAREARVRGTPLGVLGGGRGSQRLTRRRGHRGISSGILGRPRHR
jgi:hypothetical protein